MIQSVVDISVFVFSIISGIPLAVLWSVHTYFGLKGISTRIFIKNLR